MAAGKEDAVAPVVGVIMLVAITVALAVTVFLVARSFTDGAPEAGSPPVSFAQDGTTLRVVRADPGLDWVADVALDGQCDPTLNGAAFPTVSGTRVRAGDVLGCAPGEDLSISSAPQAGNTLLFQARF